MRVAAVYQPTLVNATYRSQLPMAVLRQRGHDVTAYPQDVGDAQISIAALARFDVVHVFRAIVNDDDRFVRQLHAAGVPVWFDNDDDAGAVSEDVWDQLATEVDPSGIEFVKREHERSIALMPDFDLVTTPSETLAERFRAAGAREVSVVKNYLSPEAQRIRPVERDGFTIGWHAGREHRLDRDELRIAEVLQRILEAHPHVHVATIGLDLGLAGNRYSFSEWAPFEELTNHLAGFDIGIAPLADNAFNRGRSDVKLRELAAAGVPWLASPVGPYLGLGKAEGGRLVEDDDWFDAIDRLVRSTMERTLLRRRAKAWARRETIDRMAGLWEEALVDVVEDAPRAVA